MKNKEDWVHDEVAFYDFIWKEGVKAHGSCINVALLNDFQSGGKAFEEMIQKIIEKFPTKAAALKAFKKQHGS